VFANLTGIEVQQLSNAVRIVLNADGIINVHFNDREWIDWAATNNGPFENGIKFVNSIRFRLDNLRSKTGSFFDVGQYPVSHVEVGIPPTAPEGVGLDVNIVLYTGARLNSLRLNSERMDWWGAFPAPSFEIRQSDDQRSIIVTVRSNRQALTPEMRRTDAEAGQLSHELSVATAEHGFTLHALNADLPSLSQELTRISGANIGVADGVRRYVSLYLEDLPLTSILRLLAATYGLSLTQDPGRFTLAEGNVVGNASFSGAVTQALPCVHIPATQAAELLPDFLRRYLRPDPASNTLVVSGPEALVSKVREDLAKLDHEPLQLEVEMIVVEYSRSYDLLHNLGLSIAAPGWSLATDPLKGDLSFSTLGARPTNFSARLEALETQGSLRITARGRGTCLNGGRVEVFSGATRLIQVTQNTFDGPIGLALNVDVGTRIHCHPQSVDGKVITVRLEPQVNTLAGLDPTTHMPEIIRREARGSVRFNAGDLVYVGGLANDSESVRRWRVPLLGSLPLIGGLFRGKRTTRENREMAMFMTARALSPSETPKPLLAAGATRPTVGAGASGRTERASGFAGGS
jgi:type II secretory pathway component GspD/PulD (secretin)